MIKIVVKRECISAGLRHSTVSNADVCLLRQRIKHHLWVARIMTKLRTPKLKNGARKDVRITI